MTEPPLSCTRGATEPNGMAPWCDDTIDDCGKRNRWGSHNLTTSRYLAWYKAVSDAVTGVDSQLSVGGPASSVRTADGHATTLLGQPLLACYIARFHLAPMSMCSRQLFARRTVGGTV